MSSNEDRIAKWRARREAGEVARATHGDLPTELALLATGASALTSSDSIEIDPMLALVLEALRTLPSVSAGERRQIYDVIGRGLEHGIASAAAQTDYAELRRRQSRAIIRLIEDEVRAGAVPSAPGYRPSGLEDAIAPLIAGYQRRRTLGEAEAISVARRQAMLSNEAYTIAVPAEEEGDLIYLRELMVRMDAGRWTYPRTSAPSGIRALKALVRYQLMQLRAESRLALAWTMLGPAVLLGLISLAYFLTGTRSILNMDVPTFAMIGATTWIMFRTVIFRSAAAFHGIRWLLNIRPFSPLMVGLMQGVMYLGAFGVVFPVLIVGGHFAGLFNFPDDGLAVVFWVVCVGISALAIGVIFGSVAIVWPYFLRLAPVIERALQLFSSVIFVSEQLPTDWRPYVLWSPLAHAMQLLRSAYFSGYQSDDANAEYFFISLGLLIVAAILAQGSVRWRTAPL